MSMCVFAHEHVVVCSTKRGLKKNTCIGDAEVGVSHTCKSQASLKSKPLGLKQVPSYCGDNQVKSLL